MGLLQTHASPALHHSVVGHVSQTQRMQPGRTLLTALTDLSLIPLLTAAGPKRGRQAGGVEGTSEGTGEKWRGEDPCWGMWLCAGLWETLGVWGKKGKCSPSPEGLTARAACRPPSGWAPGSRPQRRDGSLVQWPLEQCGFIQRERVYMHMQTGPQIELFCVQELLKSSSSNSTAVVFSSIIHIVSI